MEKKIKIGIIICAKYESCAGGKCLRAIRERKGAFSAYKGFEIELVGYSTCGGCPGGSIEYVPEEMKKNGAEFIHFATGFLVGYPPCPNIDYFRRTIEINYGLQAVIGTHPIPEKYYQSHLRLKTWETPEWQELIKPVLTDRETRLSYN